MGHRKPHERDLAQAAIDTEAAELRSQRWTYRQIAAHQGCSIAGAYERVKRAIAAVPYEAVEELRRVELESLDELERAALEVLRARHVKVDHGKVIMIDGQELLDDEPVLRSVHTILRIKDQRARLTGTYAPTRSEVTVHDGDSDLDREIERLLAQMGPVGEGPAPVENPSEAEPAHS